MNPEAETDNSEKLSLKHRLWVLEQIAQEMENLPIDTYPPEIGFRVYRGNDRELPSVKEQENILRLLAKQGVLTHDIFLIQNPEEEILLWVDRNKAEEMLKNTRDEMRDKSLYPIKYNPVSKMLYIGKEVIKLGGAPNQADLCELIFENSRSISKIWNRDEIFEKWGVLANNYLDRNQMKISQEYKNKVYTAGKGINEKVEKVTNNNLKDFLLVSVKTVVFNQKYKNLLAKK